VKELSAISYQLSAISRLRCGLQDFHNLEVWQKAHRLTLDVYRLTSPFPREELYGLTSQIRRSCSSIPANLAEGCGRRGDGEFGRVPADS
jgi:hypothetical protein